MQLLQEFSGFLNDYIWNREQFHLESCHVQPPPWSYQHAGKKSEPATIPSFIRMRQSPINLLIEEIAQVERSYFYFHLNVESTRKESCLQESPCLWGQVKVGECVEDEWVIVALLFQMSFVYTDISIKVCKFNFKELLFTMHKNCHHQQQTLQMSSSCLVCYYG
jgi:hypothetical protein